MRLVHVLAVMVVFSGMAMGQTCPTPAQLAIDLAAAPQGQLISLAGVSPLSCPEIPMSGKWVDGLLIFSDSPETTATRGQLYKDSTLPATSGTDYNTVWFLHVNGKASGNLKVAVLLKNTSGSSGTMTIQRKGFAGPSTDWLTVGKLARQRNLAATPMTGVTIAAGATVRMDSLMEVNIAPGNSVNGIYTYSMTQEHEITICALDQNDTTLSVCPTLSVLPRDVHNRGTFHHAGKNFDTAPAGDMGPAAVIDTANGIQQFSLGGQASYDEVVTGTDMTTGSSESLAGNIGVLYRMHFATLSSDGKKLGFVINPRGGWWGGANKSLLGDLSQNAFLCPTSGGTADNTKACVVNRYTPGGGLSVWIQGGIDGSANAPVRYIAIPY